MARPRRRKRLTSKSNGLSQLLREEIERVATQRNYGRGDKEAILGTLLVGPLKKKCAHAVKQHGRGRVLQFISETVHVLEQRSARRRVPAEPESSSNDDEDMDQAANNDDDATNESGNVIDIANETTVVAPNEDPDSPPHDVVDPTNDADRESPSPPTDFNQEQPI